MSPQHCLTVDPRQSPLDTVTGEVSQESALLLFTVWNIPHVYSEPVIADFIASHLPDAIIHISPIKLLRRPHLKY